MKDQIEYIKKSIKGHSNVSIHTGKLSDKQVKEFSKYWRLEKGAFGYTTFYVL